MNDETFVTPDSRGSVPVTCIVRSSENGVQQNSDNPDVQQGDYQDYSLDVAATRTRCPTYQELFPERRAFKWSFRFCNYFFNVEMERQWWSVMPNPSVIRFRGRDYLYPVAIIGIELKVWLRVISIINIVFILGFSYLARVIDIKFLSNNSVCNSFVCINILFLLISAINFSYQMYRRHIFIEQKNVNNAVVNFSWIFISFGFSIYEIYLQQMGSLKFLPPSIILLVLHLMNYILISNGSSYTDVKYCLLSEARTDDSPAHSTPVDRDYFFWHEIISDNNVRNNRKLTITGYICAVMNINVMFVIGLTFVYYRLYLLYLVWGALFVLIVTELRTYTFQDITCFRHSMVFVVFFNLAIMLLHTGISSVAQIILPAILIFSCAVSLVNCLYYQELKNFFQPRHAELEMTTLGSRLGITTLHRCINSSGNSHL